MSFSDIITNDIANVSNENISVLNNENNIIQYEYYLISPYPEKIKSLKYYIDKIKSNKLDMIYEYMIFNQYKYIIKNLNKNNENNEIMKIDDYLNINSYDLKDCYLCINCNNCIKCIDVNNSNNCNDCNNCRECTECNNCTDCTECNNCNNCRECDYCTDCDYCRDSMYCDICNNCYDCSKCINCINCDVCINCDNLISKQKYGNIKGKFIFKTKSNKRLQPEHLNSFLANISNLYIKFYEEKLISIDSDDKDIINEMKDFEEFNQIKNENILNDIINIIISFKKNNIQLKNKYIDNLIYNILYLQIGDAIKILSKYKIILN